MWKIMSHLDPCGLRVICDEPIEFYWKNILPNFKNLEWVEVAFPVTVKSFIAALRGVDSLEDIGPDHCGQDTNLVTLPSLRSLSIRGINFSDDGILNDLTDCLKSRDRRGYRLHTLHLSWLWCPFKPFNVWVDALSPLVKKLEVGSGRTM